MNVSIHALFTEIKRQTISSFENEKWQPLLPFLSPLASQMRDLFIVSNCLFSRQ